MDDRRRNFLSHSLRAAGAFTLGTAAIGSWSLRKSMMSGSNDIIRDAVLNSQYSANPTRLLKEFHAAEPKDLFRRYSIGFTSVVLASEASNENWRKALISDVQENSNKMYFEAEDNRHRIKAFPAALFSHILPTCTSTELSEAIEPITETYSWPQREVQEIVSQNLVSSIICDLYSWENYWVTNLLLDELAEYILVRRVSNPLLITGSSIAIQFLCYYKLALKVRKASKHQRITIEKQLSKIQKIFHSIAYEKDEYSWILRDWLNELESICTNVFKRKSYDNYFSELPPQATELIMGWRHFSKPNHPWFKLVAQAIRINSLLPYFNKLLTTGKANEKMLNVLCQKEYGLPEAEVAKAKSHTFYSEMAISETLFKQSIVGCEEGVKDNLVQIAKSTSTKKRTIENHPDWSLVPFTKYQNPIPHNIRTLGPDWIELLAIALTGTFTSKFIEEIFALAELQWNPIKERTPKDVEAIARPTKEKIEEALENSEAVESRNHLRDLLEGKPNAMWQDSTSHKKENVDEANKH